jgi:hypothetical protein
MGLLHHLARYTSSSYHTTSVYYVPVGGISVGAVFAFMAILFVCCYVHYYKRGQPWVKASLLLMVFSDGSPTAKRQSAVTGEPITYGIIILKSLAIASIVGILAFLCFGESSSNNNGNSNTVQDVENAPGAQDTQQVPFTQSPQPSYAPGGSDYWDPINSAASAPVQ